MANFRNYPPEVLNLILVGITYNDHANQQIKNHCFANVPETSLL